MRPVRVLAAVLITSALGMAAPVRIADPHMAEQYHARRADLRKALPDGITVLFGHTESLEEDLRTGFFQEANFYYLTGWREPGAILLLAPLPEDPKAPGYDAKAKLPREILFLPERNPDQEKWTGRKLGPSDPDVKGVTGFDAVMPAEKFEAELHTVLEAYARLYTLVDQPAAARLKELAPLRNISGCRSGNRETADAQIARRDRADRTCDRRHARSSPRSLGSAPLRASTSTRLPRP